MPVQEEIIAVKQLLIEGKINQAQTKINGLKPLPEVLLVKSELASDLGDFEAQYYWAEKVLNDQHASFISVVEAYYFMSLAKLKQDNLKQSERIIFAGFELIRLIKTLKEISIGEIEALFHNVLGRIHFEKDELDKALFQFQRSLFLGRLQENYLIIASNINKIAEIFDKRGQLKRADRLYKLAYFLFHDQKKKSGQALSLINIGQILRKKGEFDKALEIYQKSLELVQIIGDTYLIAYCMGSIGELYFKKGDHEVALIYLNISIQHWRGIGKLTILSSYLLIMAKILLIDNIKQNEKKVVEILDELKTLAKNKDTPEIFLHHRLLTGLTLKYSSKFKDKGEAIDLFDSIIKSDQSNDALKFEASSNYIELLLQEYKLSGEIDQVNEAIIICDSLIKLAKEKNLFGKVIDVLILKSKLITINLNIDNALELLNQAEELAKSEELNGYKERIKINIENIMQLKEKDLSTINNLTLFDQLGIERYLIEVFR